MRNPLGGIQINLNLVVYCAVLIISFLLFQQGDLVHTTMSSNAYLSGHFFNFYDYNKVAVGGNDYLPLVYIFFALWNLPLKFFGLIGDVSSPGSTFFQIQLFWSKFLITNIFFLSTWVLKKITEELAVPNAIQKNLPPQLFATSPMVIFVIFIFGQYDIFGVLFTLLGFYFYIKGDLSKFAWFFSVAISFKYFATVVFIPLLLMKEKHPLVILKFLLIGSAITLIQIAVYFHSEIFLNQIFSMAIRKLSADGRDISLLSTRVWIAIAYGVTCIYLYFKQHGKHSDWRRDAVFISIGSYALLISAVVWHPQWVIIMMPFFALYYLYIHNQKFLIYADLFGMLFYIWVCVNVWPNNVDVSMLERGLLSELATNTKLAGADFLINKPSKLFERLFFLYLFSPIVIFALQSYGVKYFQKEERVSPYLLRLRFFMGSIFFPILTLACVITPAHWIR